MYTLITNKKENDEIIQKKKKKRKLVFGLSNSRMKFKDANVWSSYWNIPTMFEERIHLSHNIENCNLQTFYELIYKFQHVVTNRKAHDVHNESLVVNFYWKQQKKENLYLPSIYICIHIYMCISRLFYFDLVRCFRKF